MTKLINVRSRVEGLKGLDDTYWVNVQALVADMSDCDPKHLFAEEDDIRRLLTDTMVAMSAAAADKDTSAYGPLRRSFWLSVAVDRPTLTAQQACAV